MIPCPNHTSVNNYVGVCPSHNIASALQPPCNFFSRHKRIFCLSPKSANSDLIRLLVCIYVYESFIKRIH